MTTPPITSIAGLLMMGLLLGGCATMPPGMPPPTPTRLVPNAAPENKQTLKGIQGGIVELGAGSYFSVLKATLNDHVVYVRVLFSNQSKKTVPFGPENITLADAGRVLVRTIGPAEIAQPYVAQAQNLQAQAQQAAVDAQAAEQQVAEYNHQQAEKSEHHRNEDESKAELAADALQAFGVTLTAVGAESTANRTAQQAQAAEQALGTFENRANVGALQSQQVPAGTKSQGMVYFAEPTQWPVTLRLEVDGRTLTVQFTPGQPHAEPPQVAVSRPDYLVGQSSADFRTMSADLRRSTFRNGIYLEAIPVTSSLISAREKWQGFKNAWTPQETAHHTADAISALQPGKSEFEIELGAYDPVSIRAVDWQGTLIDSQLKEYPVNLASSSITRDPAYVTSYYKAWFHGSAQKIDFSRPFQLRMRQAGELSDGALDVAWQIAEKSSGTLVVPPLLKSPPAAHAY